MMSKAIRTALEIRKAAKNCRKAWAGHPEAKWAWCCHHFVRLEPIDGSPEERIRYILTKKPRREQVVRLNNFRPVLFQPSEILCETWNKFKRTQDCYAALFMFPPIQYVYYLQVGREATETYIKAVSSPDIDEAHRRDVPDHTWNGKSIFLDGGKK